MSADENSSLFSISTEPEDNNDGEILLYHKEYSILPDEENQKSKKSKFLCFNCGVGEHNMNECPQKFDRLAVMKNRAAFNLRRQMHPGMSHSREFKRYHIEIEGAIKAEAAPGRISDKLRAALGLSKYQLPPYIYKMRLLGYPPGWLEEAKISPSGINMIDTNGERVPNPEEEEGEIFVAKTRFDFSKLIDYPGFNVWPNPDTINETDRYRAPQMQYSHSKAAFVEYLKSQMEEDVEFQAPVCDMSIDMDAEEVEEGYVIEGTGEFLPPLPADHPPDTPPPPPEEKLAPPTPASEEGAEAEEGEIVRRGVKRSLEDPDNPNAKSPRTSQDSALNESINKTSENNSSIEDYSTPNLTMNSSFGRVIAVESGTPALKLHSPFTNLPPSEAFRKDITDVINFENLPNSTGKYEKLKGILRSVREKLNIFRTQSGSN